MLSFNLNSDFVNGYRDLPEPFGFNGLGSITFYRTYSRNKADGSRETWVDVCERVINGMYSIQKDHALIHGVDWSDEKAHRSAEEAFDRLFKLKWSPSGRGLDFMGTDFIHERHVSEALQNCAYISTENLKNDGGKIFYWFMEMLMLGVGVGSDMKGANTVFVYKPNTDYLPITYCIDDTREDWAASVSVLINSYLIDNSYEVVFDYSNIRPKGKEIKGFGGISSGPEPLMKLHEQIRAVLDKNVYDYITVRTLADIFNMIGACVVSGNVRRSAEILFGDKYDSEFYNLKNYDLNPERSEYAWTSNNSMFVNIGDDYTRYTENILKNGEPGFAWLENVHKYGRMGEEKLDNGIGFNPCAEQPLADKELCNLVEIHIGRNENLQDYLRTLKFAYLYGKTVTLTYDWIDDADSRSIMQQNRRIGLSNTGIAQFVSEHNLDELKKWLTTGYEFVKHYDLRYSNWLKISESIRLTTVKPSGTVSLLSGSTPGVHYPHSEYYIRRIRIQEDASLANILVDAGIPVEPDLYSANTVVAEFPIHAGNHIQSVQDMSVWEQFAMAAFMQKYWSDNSVSVTISVDPKTVSGKDLAKVLDVYQYQLKSVSILPISEEGAYEQMPYETITKEEYQRRLNAIDFSMLSGLANRASESNGHQDLYCGTDACEIQFIPKETEGDQNLFMVNT